MKNPPGITREGFSIWARELNGRGRIQVPLVLVEAWVDPSERPVPSGIQGEVLLGSNPDWGLPRGQKEQTDTSNPERHLAAGRVGRIL